MLGSDQTADGGRVLFISRYGKWGAIWWILCIVDPLSLSSRLKVRSAFLFFAYPSVSPFMNCLPTNLFCSGSEPHSALSFGLDSFFWHIQFCLTLAHTHIFYLATGWWLSLACHLFPTKFLWQVFKAPIFHSFYSFSFLIWSRNTFTWYLWQLGGCSDSYYALFTSLLFTPSLLRLSSARPFGPKRREGHDRG